MANTRLGIPPPYCHMVEGMVNFCQVLWIAQTLTLQGRVSERQPPHLLAFAAQGRNVAVGGRIELTATAPATTVCRVVVEAEVNGRLAPIVDLISRTTQKQMIAQTIEQFP